jgi:hypothetical protein
MRLISSPASEKPGAYCGFRESLDEPTDLQLIGQVWTSHLIDYCDIFTNLPQFEAGLASMD